ncbi:MAG TPA: hypothetical protein VMA98_06305 [Candidatus Acidoferrales bacterium]|nr:hypothetical protein [Candidatus Acidoferrales bacterium]
MKRAAILAAAVLLLPSAAAAQAMPPGGTNAATINATLQNPTAAAMQRGTRRRVFDRLHASRRLTGPESPQSTQDYVTIPVTSNVTVTYAIK